MGEYATVLKVTRESMLAGAELYRVIESSSEADDDEPIMVPRGKPEGLHGVVPAAAPLRPRRVAKASSPDPAT